MTPSVSAIGRPAWSATGRRRSLHEDELDEFGGIVFSDWTVPAGGGSLLGAKTYFRTETVDSYETREETTLELYHAPVR